MTTTRSLRTGTIDWAELTTPDIEGAFDFYGRVLGWTYTSLGDRSLAEVEGRKAAGIAPQLPTIGDMQLPSAWTIFIRTDDIAATLHRATELGGVVVNPPEDFPEGWRTAVMMDPTGASFALVQASADFGFGTEGDPGALVWCDLTTRNPTAAEAFYRELLGWVAEFDAESGYTTFTLNGQRVAGMLDMPPQLPSDAPSHWLPYFRVEDVRAACEIVSEADGNVEVAPRRVDSMTFAILEDPAGAVFGLLELDEASPVDQGYTAVSYRSRIVGLLREGNRRQIIVRDRSGRRMVELPLNFGVVAVVAAPFATAAGALAAAASRWSITVARADEDSTSRR